MTELLRRFALAAVLAVLAACAHNEPPPPAPPVAVEPQHESCTAKLDDLGITFEKQKDFHTAEGCGIDQNVRVDHSPIPLIRPAAMSCGFAVTLGEFEVKVVQPLAKRYFKKEVTMLAHAGTYACRGERGGNAARLSQHAYGKAIDIIGFELSNGEHVSVLHDWHGDDAKAKFLHELAKESCKFFDVVITPNHNSFHLDHIHVDTGPYKLCGI